MRFFTFLTLLITALILNCLTAHARVGISSEVFVAQAGNIVLPANSIRHSVYLSNSSGTGTITVKLDAIPDDDNDGFVLKINTNETVILPVTNAIYARASDVAGNSLEIIEVIQ